MGGTIKDRTNLKYGKLTAIKIVGKDKYNRPLWSCICDCGNELITCSTLLGNGHKKSCGCLITDINKAKRLEKGMVGLNKVFRLLHRRSKKRNQECSITKEQVRELTTKACYYCNKIGTSVSRHAATVKNLTQEAIDNGAYTYNGLDRIDNDKGYTLDNVLTCCGDCNNLRGFRMSVEETKQVVTLLKQIRGTEDIWKS